MSKMKQQKKKSELRLDINKAFRLKTLVESGNFDLTISE